MPNGHEPVLDDEAGGRRESDRAPGLDSISKAIIEQLQSDGRRAYARIASVVGLSEAAVRQRVARLVDAGVMQIVAVTNPLQLGFTRQAMIGIKAEGNLEPVVDALRAMDEVDYVVLTAGSFDILVGGLRRRRPPARPAQPAHSHDPGRPRSGVLRLPEACETDLPVGDAVNRTRGTTPLDLRRVHNNAREHAP